MLHFQLYASVLFQQVLIFSNNYYMPEICSFIYSNWKIRSLFSGFVEDFSALLADYLKVALYNYIFVATYGRPGIPGSPLKNSLGKEAASPFCPGRPSKPGAPSLPGGPTSPSAPRSPFVPL